MDAKTINRFMSKVAVNEDSGCWEWTGAKEKRGYGFFWFNRRQVGSHRFSFMAFVGEIAKGNLVCHKCDNPKCVNPYHIFQGTHKDNMQDRNKKGRQTNGEEHGSARLTNQDVILIKKFIEQKSYRSGNFLARWFGVSQVRISAIKTGKTWRHI